MHANESNPCILFLFWHCWQFLHKPSLVRGLWKYRSSSRHSVGLSTQHITTPMVKMSAWAPYLSISNLKNTWIKQGFYNSYLLPILVNIWSFARKTYSWRWPELAKKLNCLDSLLIHSYLFPNLKHLLCLTSVILEVEVSCLFAGLVIESFSIAFMNLRKCLMYSGYVSRLQWPPPLTHKGSYFSFDNSHKRFPCDKSTMSSFVPCKCLINKSAFSLTA